MKSRHPDDAQRPSDDESVEATAAAWLAERDGGLSAADAARFALWRAQDPRHEAAAARLERTWAALQPLRDFRPEAVRHPDRNLLTRPSRGRRVVSLPVLVTFTALAACVAIAAVRWFDVRRAAGAAEQVFSTTVEGYERVALDDGSIVELNSASEVGVRFSPAERRVRLVRGEAHFTVAKNKARPFVVEAGGVAVRAVGTAFNVRLGTREVEVLVTEGKVAVAPVLPAPAATPAAAAASELVANQRMVISAAPVAARAAATPVIERVEPAAMREALAWQGHRLVFADTPLAEAVAQFNRRNSVQLELADPELATLPIGGSFGAGNVESFARLLVSGGDVVMERPEPTRIVLRKAK